MLYDYLIENYKLGEPIFLSDVKPAGISDVNVRQQFKVLTDTGRVMRYGQGIYFLPKKTHIKEASGPAADTVAYCKYVFRCGDVQGYYTGHTFANRIGLSAQVPREVEIVSNNIAAKRKEIQIGRQSYIIRKAVIPVTKDNCRILPLLDLLKNLDVYADESREHTAKKLSDYVRQNNLKRAQIDQYIPHYPDSTYRYFYEMKLEYVFA